MHYTSKGGVRDKRGGLRGHHLHVLDALITHAALQALLKETATAGVATTPLKESVNIARAMLWPRTDIPQYCKMTLLQNFCNTAQFSPA